ncbi:MAG: DUF2156 domain-containing protein [Oscillospiraceae bacterium]|nr:DUF2156 domain-containing protein [Oscillospiraceae bacterium]
MSLCFHSPVPADRAAAAAAANSVRAMENDAAFANLYLLREKYGTELCVSGGMLFRRYHSGIRAGCYGFPLGNGDLREAVSLLAADADERGIPLRLTLLTKAQCEQLEALFPAQFTFEPMPDYTEYLYLQENLAALRGSRYHGKRNHIAQFWRGCPEAYIQPLIAENADIAVGIAEQWLAARSDPDEPSLRYELSCIREAAANWEALHLTGLLLYDGANPIGMTVVSEISAGVFDIHFEKVVPAHPHAWPVVVNEMAKCLAGAAYLNREEDLGERGMRSSKQSYRPDLLNEKYTALRRGKEL